MSAAESYILLGLRLGRHVEGLVDAYYGPEDLARQIESEPLAEPEALVADADALLARLDDGWLADQVRGLRTYAGLLAGEQLSYSDEVERCYGVRPERVSTDIYAEVHEELDELLPGAGDLAARWEEWKQARLVPPDKVVPALGDVVEVLRERTRRLLDLPEGEALELEAVRDEPWWAFNYYLGGLSSRVVANIDVPTTADDIVELAAHEVYPGHHTEHASKEQRFIRERDELEESIQLVPTPAALLQEGVAEIGAGFVLDGDVPERVVEILRRHGVEYDLKHSRRVRALRQPLRRMGLDAALMIHEDGAPPEEVQAYLERWGLFSPDHAQHSIRFVTDPTWRAYVITYSAGGDLCRRWTAGDQARFVRLLTEHMRVSDLAAALAV